MLLIILLILVLGIKSVYLKENFFCEWTSKAENAKIERDERKQQYYQEEKLIKDALQQVRDKQDEINVRNYALEKSLINANVKFSKIIPQYQELIEDYSKTIINSENCENFNKLKLIAIKKIYS